MRKILMVCGCFLLVVFLTAAGLSTWTTLDGDVADGDWIGITDVSDTTQSASGSSKKVLALALKSYILNLTDNYNWTGIHDFSQPITAPGFISDAVDGDRRIEILENSSGNEYTTWTGKSGLVWNNGVLSIYQNGSAITWNDLSAATTESYSECIYIEDPDENDDLQSIWRPTFATTITGIWAESDQTVNFDLQVDDGTPADVNGTDISPAAGTAEDTSLSGDTTMLSGDRLDLAVTSVANTPTWVSICWSYTKD